VVLTLLTGPGIIQRLDFGGFILLRPEVLAAVVRKYPHMLSILKAFLDWGRMFGNSSSVTFTSM
ncbi:MAG: hypothetical protein KJO08_10390, partial [Gammaproteobacteria bacterium]|nr:hypothetical protein [Gammaproteobacteria bacterium]